METTTRDPDGAGRTPVDVARLTPLTPTGTPRHDDAVTIGGYRMWLHIRDTDPPEVLPGVLLSGPRMPCRSEPEVRLTIDYRDPNNVGRPLRAIDDPAARAAADLHRLAPQVALEVWAPNAPGVDSWAYALMPLLGPHPARRTYVVGTTGAELHYRLRAGSPWGYGRWPVADDGHGNPALLPHPVTDASMYLIASTTTRPPETEPAHHVDGG